MGTNTEYALKYVADRITPGDGSAPNKPLVVVMLVTDAVENSIMIYKTNPDPNDYSYEHKVDEKYNLHDPHYPDGTQKIQGILPEYCNTIKEKGAKMMTLLTDYVVLPGTYDARDIFIRENLVPNNAINMAKCSSDPDRLAFRVSTQTGIYSSIKKMIESAPSSRLTK